jgi:predicted nucleotidyltransferase
MKSAKSMTMNPEPKTLEQIAKRFGVRMILLFGSTVTGQIHVNSDLSFIAGTLTQP